MPVTIEKDNGISTGLWITVRENDGSKQVMVVTRDELIEIWEKIGEKLGVEDIRALCPDCLSCVCAKGMCEEHDGYNEEQDMPNGGAHVC